MESMPPEARAEFMRQVHALPGALDGLGKIQRDEIRARDLGLSRTSMQRLHYIRHMAADDTLPPAVRAVARQAWTDVEQIRIIHGGQGVIEPAYRAVKGAEWEARAGVPQCLRGVRPAVPGAAAGREVLLPGLSPACRPRTA
jgi:hypothetical protein